MAAPRKKAKDAEKPTPARSPALETVSIPVSARPRRGAYRSQGGKPGSESSRRRAQRLPDPEWAGIEESTRLRPGHAASGVSSATTSHLTMSHDAAGKYGRGASDRETMVKLFLRRCRSANKEDFSSCLAEGQHLVNDPALLARSLGQLVKQLATELDGELQIDAVDTLEVLETKAQSIQHLHRHHSGALSPKGMASGPSADSGGSPAAKKPRMDFESSSAGRGASGGAGGAAGGARWEDLSPEHVSFASVRNDDGSRRFTFAKFGDLRDGKLCVVDGERKRNELPTGRTAVSWVPAENVFLLPNAHKLATGGGAPRKEESSQYVFRRVPGDTVRRARAEFHDELKDATPSTVFGFLVDDAGTLTFIARGETNEIDDIERRAKIEAQRHKAQCTVVHAIDTLDSLLLLSVGHGELGAGFAQRRPCVRVQATTPEGWTFEFDAIVDTGAPQGTGVAIGQSVLRLTARKGDKKTGVDELFRSTYVLKCTVGLSAAGGGDDVEWIHGVEVEANEEVGALQKTPVVGFDVWSQFLLSIPPCALQDLTTIELTALGAE